MRLMNQTAPDPTILFELVDRLAYRPGWQVTVQDIVRDVDREKKTLSRGLTLIITTSGYDSYHVDRGQTYRVNHYFPVPPATYDERSWRHWLFEQFVKVERHEAAEFFAIDGARPYAPHHGPGNDPYITFELGTDEDRRTRFTGEVLPA